jgi:hypothetical protein
LVMPPLDDTSFPKGEGHITGEVSAHTSNSVKGVTRVVDMITR